MEPLSGPEAMSAIKVDIAKSNWVRLAVAYWGRGAVEKLGLSDARTKDVRIVCDLLSGGCNPEVVKQLLDLFGYKRIRAKPRLHSKVWLTEQSAVVGSSNASANGLGHEGDEAEVLGLIEANVRITPFTGELWRAWTEWFEREAWSGSQEITRDMLKEAKRQWQRNRQSRDEGKIFRGSLLKKMRDESEFFRDKDLEVWIWQQDESSDKAWEILEAEKKTRNNNELSQFEGFHGTPGQYIIEFDWNAQRKRAWASYEGMWRVLQDRPNIERDGISVCLVRPIKSFEGLTIGDDGQEAWCEAASMAMKSDKLNEDGEISAFEFAKLIAPTST